MTDDKTQPQQKHVVASPNPRAEGPRPFEKTEGELKATEIPPAGAVKASPMKSKKKRKARTTKPRP